MVINMSRKIIFSMLAVLSLSACAPSLDDKMKDRRSLLAFEKTFYNLSKKDPQKFHTPEYMKSKGRQLECDAALVETYDKSDASSQELKFEDAKSAFSECWAKYDRKVIDVTPNAYKLEPIKK